MSRLTTLGDRLAIGGQPTLGFACFFLASRWARSDDHATRGDALSSMGQIICSIRHFPFWRSGLSLLRQACDELALVDDKRYLGFTLVAYGEALSDEHRPSEAYDQLAYAFHILRRSRDLFNEIELPQLGIALLKIIQISRRDLDPSLTAAESRQLIDEVERYMTACGFATAAGKLETNHCRAS